MKSLSLRFLVVLSLLSLAVLTSGTLSKSDKKKKKINESPGNAGVHVEDLGLVTEHVKAKDIVNNHANYAKEKLKNFNGKTLAYVTPWNNHGYDTAKRFSPKFNFVSPVWLQIRRKSGGYDITGGHDIDQGWVKDVRADNGDVKIVPRLLFEGWTMDDYNAVFSDESEIQELADYVVGFFQAKSLDGCVVEIWSQFGGHKKSELTHLLTHFAKAVRDAQLVFILVIPPMRAFDKRDLFTKTDFKNLSPFVDAFSLMTYDFSSSRPGPNAPIDWMKGCVEKLTPKASDRDKILLGLNFYGYDFSKTGSNPIVGPSYVDLINTKKPKVMWDSNHGEHFFTYKHTDGSEHTVWFPTLKSIDVRLSLAAELGTGVSIWEIGQGLDYFFDLL